ncbi:hypothetical protein [Rhizobium ruizarguesonis]|uniref:hypothetical protein n=1 Tax=Rhizobium ruizarguesonis TaxID=2081791 RepID=UPI001FE02F53|nr:hypothetical protein [Rhizobium ruizarguesonis]
MFPAPPLEGFIVVVQHRPDVARRIEGALSHAGATVFVVNTAAETIAIMIRYQAHLVVVNTHDVDGLFNEHVVFAAFHRRRGGQAPRVPSCLRVRFDARRTSYGNDLESA